MFLDSLASDQTETHEMLGTEMQKLKHITVCHESASGAQMDSLRGARLACYSRVGGTVSVLLERGTLPAPHLDR